MSWLRTYPYTSLVAAAAIVLLAIIFLIQARAQQAPSGSNVQFSSVPAPYDTGVADPESPSYGAPSAEASPNAGAGTSALTPFSLPAYTPAPEASASSVEPDTSAILATLANAPAQNSGSADTSAEQSLDETYSLFSMMSATSSAETLAPAQTPLQQSLFTYGNEAGLAVLSFENAHTTMTSVLKNWLSDTSDPSAQAAVNGIANDMAATGQTLNALSNVPAPIEADNAALAGSFEDASQKLLAIVQAGGNDTALVNALQTYDASADTFTTNYAAMVNLFSAYGVTFSASDPGSAFEFSSAGGL